MSDRFSAHLLLFHFIYFFPELGRHLKNIRKKRYSKDKCLFVLVLMCENHIYICISEKTTEMLGIRLQTAFQQYTHVYRGGYWSFFLRLVKAGWNALILFMHINKPECENKRTKKGKRQT